MALELQEALQVGGQLEIVFYDEDGHAASCSRYLTQVKADITQSGGAPAEASQLALIGS
jgi:hypothetical protein